MEHMSRRVVVNVSGDQKQRSHMVKNAAVTPSGIPELCSCLDMLDSSFDNNDMHPSTVDVEDVFLWVFISDMPCVLHACLPSHTSRRAPMKCSNHVLVDRS